ncbi:MAG: hypothetical protein U0T84_10115 [Chitinophagales bacterium]
MQNSDLARYILIQCQRLDQGQLPAIERDILLEKIRILYDAIQRGAMRNQNDPEPEVVSIVAEAVTSSPSVVLVEEKKEKQPVSEEVIETSKSQIPEPTKHSLNEIYSGTATNEPLHQQVTANQGINEQFAAGDLKALIDLNKQIVLTKDLFQGDGTAFLRVIEALNGAVTFQQANDMLQQFQQSFQWNKDTQAARLMDKLVRIKFNQP